MHVVRWYHRWWHRLKPPVTFLALVTGLCLGLTLPHLYRMGRWVGTWAASKDWVCSSPPDAGVDDFTQLQYNANKLANDVWACRKEHKCEPIDGVLLHEYKTPDCEAANAESFRKVFQSGVEAGHLDYSETLDCYTLDCPATKLGCTSVIYNEDGDLITAAKIITHHR